MLIRVVIVAILVAYLIAVFGWVALEHRRIARIRRRGGYIIPPADQRRRW